MGGLWERVNNMEFQNFLSPDPKFDKVYYDNYIKERKVINIVYIFIFAIYSIVGIASLITFYCLRKWYIIRQRGFWLTFINGIFAFISGFVTLLVQIVPTPCALSLYTSNVINPFYNLIFFCRSLRIVLLYHFNIFKVSELKRRNRKRIKESYSGEKEPNSYLPKIYKTVDRIIYFVIAIPTVICFIITLYLDNIYLSENNIECSLFKASDANEQVKKPQINNAFAVARIFGSIIAIAMTVMLFALAKVKDNSKYGVKFECISTILLIVIITALNMILNNFIIGKSREYHLDPGQQAFTLSGRITDSSNYPRRIFLKIFDYTKGGKVLFCIISCYMIFATILLPCIKCIKSKKEQEKYFNEPTNSIQYFYKILNSPPLIEELKSIAIKEFSVENILFWENYQVLQKMVYRYQMELRIAERYGDPLLVSQYDFESYYQQQLQAFSVSSMDEYSYDPNMPVPKELLSYYVSFYQTFIHSLGPASVNISGTTIKRIYNDFCSYPTVGIYDNAKNEVVEMMYSSLFPIFLRRNRKNLNNNPYKK